MRQSILGFVGFIALGITLLSPLATQAQNQTAVGSSLTRALQAPTNTNANPAKNETGMRGPSQDPCPKSNETGMRGPSDEPCPKNNETGMHGPSQDPCPETNETGMHGPSSVPCAATNNAGMHGPSTHDPDED